MTGLPEEREKERQEEKEIDHQDEKVIDHLREILTMKTENLETRLLNLKQNGLRLALLSLEMKN